MAFSYSNFYSTETNFAESPPISRDQGDHVVWGPTGATSFSCAAAKEAIRVRGPTVSWYNVVWFKGYIPQMAIIMWMAFRKRILTKNKLKMWGCIQKDTCCLCNMESEDKNHLFLRCTFSQKIWNTTLKRNGIRRGAGTWDQEAGWAIEDAKGTGFKAKMRCPLLATVVYSILHERNTRIFQQKAQNWEGVMLRIEVIVKAATWQWKACRNFEN